MLESAAISVRKESKMKPLNIKKYFESCMLYFLFGLFLISASACGGGSGTSNEASSETGSIAFKLAESAGSQNEMDGLNPSDDLSDANYKTIYSSEIDPSAYKNDLFQITSLDCIVSGVTTIEAIVYTSDNDFLIEGRPWPCEAHQGTITGVPVGTNLKVVVLARDVEGNIIYRGEQTDLTVTAGQTTDAGPIIIHSFVPTLSAPADQSDIANGDLILQWNQIIGAAEYWILVSENNDLSDPIIDVSVSDWSYTFQDYSILTTYYWQVIAVDFDGNSSVGSEIWSFTILNNPPTASIESPSSESQYFWGEETVFAGAATDHEDGTLTGASLIWTSSLDGTIGTGANFSTNSLSVGAHAITLTATDSHGDTASVTITVTILNNPPTAIIQNPANNSQFLFGENTISFNGNAVDPEDGTLTGSSMVWTSNLDGTIGTGTNLSTNNLSVGTHTITLTATDSHGARGSDTITITVAANNPPIATINSPPDGSQYFLDGDFIPEILFSGTGEDIEDGMLTGQSLVWTSSLDGQFGTGNSFNYSELSVGSHTITLTATDNHGAQGSDTITITVAANNPPTATINSPSDGSQYFLDGDFIPEILFSGTGEDIEDGILPGQSLVWTSSIDGQIVIDSFTYNDLSEGAHTITLTATDSQGAQGSDSVEIYIGY